MELSVKDKILLAMYSEYQKDIPDMDKVITWDNLNVGQKEFFCGIEKLLNEHLINGGRYKRGSSNEILMVFMDTAMPSNIGLNYVENRLLQDVSEKVKNEDDPKTGNLRRVIRNAVAFGWDEIKDIAAKTLAEMSKNK